MRKCMDEVKILIDAGITCIWITSYEEAAVLADIREMVRMHYRTIPLYQWSVSEGCKKLATLPAEKDGPADMNLRQPPAVMEKIANDSGCRAAVGSRNIYVLRDLQEFFAGQSSTLIRRYIRDIKEYPGNKGCNNVIICISPAVALPDDITKLFRVVSYELPDKEEVLRLTQKYVEKFNKLAQKQPLEYEELGPEKIDSIVDACLGLTKKEIGMSISESIVRHHTIDPTFLLSNKIQEVKKSGILDYKIPEITLDDVGGNQAIKDWLYEQKEMFSQEARDFSLPMPKGYMAVGIPGSAKTMLAEAFAGMMNIPLLSLSMSKIMSKLVGESEQKIEQAIQVAKSCAPCVLLLDEVEKMLGGAGAGGSSNRTDGGVTNRVFQSLLKFMNDNDSGVYVIMTSNDVSALPPEFTRAGRIDAQWYFGLPKVSERKEILRIHFAKFGKDVPDNVIDLAAKETEGYTGAELREVAKNCMRKAFIRFKNSEKATIGFTVSDVESSISEVIPISKSSKEKIMALESWCAERARRSDYEEVETDNAHNDQPLFGGVFSM